MMRRILVLDDHPLVREVVKSMLVGRGFDVVLTCSGEEAIAVFPTSHCVAGIIDVDLPGIDGVATCRELRRLARAANRTCEFMLMTGVLRDGLNEAAERAGAVAVLPKPFTADQLFAALEHTLRFEPASLTR